MTKVTGINEKTRGQMYREIGTRKKLKFTQKYDPHPLQHHWGGGIILVLRFEKT